jgi:hypothetical protein
MTNVRMAAMTVPTTSKLARISGILARWFAIVGFLTSSLPI